MTNETIIKIEMTGEQWNSIITPILAINHEIRFNFNSDGLKYGCIDTKNVSMISADISKCAFEHYHYNYINDNIELGFDLNEISDLKVKKEIIVFEVVKTIKEGEYQFKVTLGKHTRFIDMLPLDTIRKTPIPPVYEEKTTYEGVMEVKNLFEIIGNLKKIDNNIIFRKSAGNLIISAKNGTSKHEYKAEIVEIKSENDTFISMFDTQYLNEILKAIKGQVITIKLETDLPIIIKYEVISGSTVSFMLAPRIE